MLRNSNLSVRKAQGVSNARAEGLNRAEVDAYFQLLQNVLEEHHIMAKPSNIYNVDECGLQLNNEPGTVIAEKGSKAVHVRQSTERGETISVVACCNAEGSFIPPFVIFKGVKMQQVWVENLPPGAVLEMRRESSYINEHLFLKWFENHFLPRKPEGPCVLIMDGHSSHVNSPDLLEKALENDVHFVCLPSHTTHFLQPLDRTFFKALKSYYSSAATEWGSANHGKKIERRHFGILLQKAWSKSATTSNASSGFRACGIYPFQPSAIPDYAYLNHSENPDVQRREESQNHEPTPPRQQDDNSSLNSVVLTPTKILQNFSPTSTSTLTSTSRRKQSAKLLTTVENIADKAEKRRKRLIAKEKKSFGNQKKVFQPRTVIQHLYSSSEDECLSVHDTSEDCDLLSSESGDDVSRPINIGDFLIVQFATKKSLINYIAEVKLIENDTFKVSFLRKKGRYFHYPPVEDIANIVEDDIIKKLSPLNCFALILTILENSIFVKCICFL